MGNYSPQCSFFKQEPGTSFLVEHKHFRGKLKEQMFAFGIDIRRPNLKVHLFIGTTMDGGRYYLSEIIPLNCVWAIPIPPLRGLDSF